MTFDLFRLLFDYYSLRSIENSFESLRRNGSKLFYISLYFVRHTRKPAEMHSIRVRPHNSDSEGRRFESCRAYHTATAQVSRGGYLYISSALCSLSLAAFLFLSNAWV